MAPTIQTLWENSFAPEAGGDYAGKSYWICTEDWYDFLGGSKYPPHNESYPFDVALDSKEQGTGCWTGSHPNGIVIGKDLADKLNSKLGDKVVILTNTPDGTITSDVFRIAGIYETFSSVFDKAFIYIPIGNAQQMLDIGDNIHELAIITLNYNQVDKVKEQIVSNLNDEYEVLSYKDILPMLLG